jgi:hypothetical protein
MNAVPEEIGRGRVDGEKRPESATPLLPTFLAIPVTAHARLLPHGTGCRRKVTSGLFQSQEPDFDASSPVGEKKLGHHVVWFKGAYLSDKEPVTAE